MSDRILSTGDIEYIADMLRAVVWVKHDLGGVSKETLIDLTTTLDAAEAALRRFAAEIADDPKQASTLN